MFNILEHSLDFESLEVLDLFTGTGSISYEFASRGCKGITAVDINSKCIEFIKTIAGNLLFEQIKPIRTDVFKFLKMNKKPYDLVFADPPYMLENLDEIPEMVLTSNILVEGGLFVLEHPDNYNFQETPFFSQHRSYGGVNFSFFEFSAV